VVYHGERGYQLGAGAAAKQWLRGIEHQGKQYARSVGNFTQAPDVVRHQHVEIPGHHSHRRALSTQLVHERDGAVRRNDFVSRVHNRLAQRNSWSATSATRAAGTRVMQRWSMGHSRNRQGLHSTGSRTTRASAPVGPVVESSVAPKTATVGTPNAEAMCMAPESLVRKTRHAATSSINSLSVVAPARLWPATPACPTIWVTVWHSSRSPSEPKNATEPPWARAVSMAASAKRSGSQRLAVPYAAPGLTPTTGTVMPSCSRRPAPLARAASAPSRRMVSLAGISSISPARRSISR